MPLTSSSRQSRGLREQLERVNTSRAVHTWEVVGLKLQPKGVPPVPPGLATYLPKSLIPKAENETETVFEGFIYRRTASSSQSCSNLGNR